jgi:hypothetical protein
LQKAARRRADHGVPFRERIEQVLDLPIRRDAFLDTAALVANLDLVVASDSMNAHLAARSGGRRSSRCARSRIGAGCSGATIARGTRPRACSVQTTDGDWGDVFTRIAVAASEAAGWSAK